MRTLKELQAFQTMLIENATKSETKLCRHLDQEGYNFEFQYIIQPFIVDFYFPKQRAVVELDSPRFHNKIKDASRDLYLNNAGYKILRIPSYKVFKSSRDILYDIKKFLKD